MAATLICERLTTGRYLAIDRSKKMVEAATKRNQHFVDSGLAHFMESALETLKLGDRRFDKVLAMRVRLFHDHPEQARALAQRWLTAHGKLFVQYDEPGE